jgi:UDPglucose 6-dehydrogenase
MKVCVIGSGYVGLVTAACLSDSGNHVIGVDKDADKVARLARGESTIFEPGLSDLLTRNLKAKRLSFTTDLAAAVAQSRVAFIAVGTPPKPDGTADLSAVEAVAEAIGRALTQETVIVNKSTVPVGTADRVRVTVEKRGLEAGTHFDVVSNPEFLREGAAVDDFMKPDRVVIGTSSDQAAQKMERLYEPFVRQGNPILIVDERSAEMIKYAANAILATRISFMNEIANLCERVGANVDKVRLGISKDHRIGKHFLYAGIGFGGSCFPKDVQALARTGKQHDYEFQILESVLDVNDAQRRKLVDRLDEYFDGDLEGRDIAIWGLAFKPNTDDIREAPSHIIIQELLDRGANIVAFDPEAVETTRKVFGDQITYAPNMYEALNDAESLVICTEWHEFRRPEFGRMQDRMNQPVVFDGRNLYDPGRMAEMGFDYYSIGRPHLAPEDDKQAIETAIMENGIA